MTLGRPVSAAAFRQISGRPDEGIAMTGKRVLVVDDERTVSTLVTRAVESLGCEAIQSFDGYEAYDLGMRENFDLALVDMFLPGLLGIEILSRWQGAARPFPVIMVSGSNAEDDIVQSLEMGAADYVTKPFRVRELLARIKVQLRHSPSSRILDG